MQSSTARRDLELKAAAVIELRRRKASKKTVFGVVSPTDGLIRRITKVKGRWVESTQEPDMYIAEKMERVLVSDKRFIVLIGGRGSSKSVGVVDLCIADAKDTGAKTYCLREFQSSIKNSVYSLIKSEVDRHQIIGFDMYQNSIGFKGNECFEFAGLGRNIESVKSTHGFKRFTVEEAQFISQDSLDALTPTIRAVPKAGLPTKFLPGSVLEDIETHPDLDSVSIIFIANPGSIADPFSKRFIEPFREKMVDGVYEDDMHLVVMMNYDDNPWFDDSGLDIERRWDYINRSRAYYRHRWHADYNDTVEDAIIKAEWFDACVDAHKIERLKKVFEPRGAKVASHDPFNDGADAGGYALRHGSIIKYVKKKTTGEIDEACDWATGLAATHGADWFVWDGDGMGTGLKRQVETAFAGTNTKWHIYYGSASGSGQDNADKIYLPAVGEDDETPRTYAETFKNNRAQYYVGGLAHRMYNTYRCVVRGEYVDPDEMISFDSDGIDDMSGFRSEVCRLPRKPNPGGLIQLYSKEEMRAMKIKSPNQGDSVKMTLWMPPAKKEYLPINYPELRIV